MSRWIRLYTHLPDDPKAQLLRPELFKFWINCLCLAGKNSGNLPTISDLSFSLRLKPSKASLMIGELVSAGLFDQEGEELTAHDWKFWQYESDTSTDRVKRHRERSMKRSMKRSSNGEDAVSASVSVSVTSVSVDSSKTENTSTRAREDEPEFPGPSFEVSIPPPRPLRSLQDPHFHGLVGMFLDLGVAICDADMQRCARLWLALPEEDQRSAVSDVLEKHAGEWSRCEERFIPRPWNYLADRRWSRRAIARGRDRPKSRGESAFDAAARNFMEEPA